MRFHLVVSLCGLVLNSAPGVAGQELEPRSYAANPVGMSFVIGAVGHSTGAVVLDPTLPLSGVRASLYSLSLGLGHIFSLFARTASVSLGLPYAWGDMQGNLGEVSDSIERSGLADARLRLALNLLGGPALRLPAFAERKPSTVLGTSLIVVAPTGEYLPDKLINLGANRWAFKPEVGLSHPAGRWTLELYAGCWFFTRNSDFFGGQEKDQRPLSSFQAHVGYTIKPRLWLASDATFYSGGRTVVDGVVGAERQESTRIGITVSVPVARAHSVKLAWSTGASVRFGGDFDTYLISWQTTLF